jgi:hypothetical protein
MSDQARLFVMPDPEEKPKPAGKVRTFAPVEEMVARLTVDPWEREKLPRIWAYYLERTERTVGYMATELRMKKGLARLRESVAWAGGNKGNALRAWKLVIDNVADDPFLSGENDRHTRYQDWVDHITKSWECWEKRLHMEVKKR